MKSKNVFSFVLIAFVAVSVVFALRKVTPDSATSQDQAAEAGEAAIAEWPVGLNAKLAETRFSAVYFHAPHRCPTCRKIESFSHEALTTEIEAGTLAWQIADYTSANNASLVDQFKVFTSTVVLVETQDGKVVRWKNLQQVWNHTGVQADFTAFIHQAWNDFRNPSEHGNTGKVSQAISETKLVSALLGENDFVQYGTMHEAIGEQKSEGRIALAALLNRPNFYGVGALENLLGEITIFDSRAVISKVDSFGNVVPMTEEQPAQATMLAGAYVENWTETKLISLKSESNLESQIEKYARDTGLDSSRPFAFTIVGRVEQISFHVINGRCPMHAKNHNKPIAKGMEPVQKTLKDIDATLVGIFADRATGNLTHPGTKVHMHLIYKDDQGIEKTGHVENVRVSDGAILRLPQREAK
jgi:alpha-acetolactate decarboxylase